MGTRMSCRQQSSICPFSVEDFCGSIGKFKVPQIFPPHPFCRSDVPSRRVSVSCCFPKVHCVPHTPGILTEDHHTATSLLTSPCRRDRVVALTLVHKRSLYFSSLLQRCPSLPCCFGFCLRRIDDQVRRATTKEAIMLTTMPRGSRCRTLAVGLFRCSSFSLSSWALSFALYFSLST